MSATLDRPLVQRLTALQAANDIRLWRAQLKRELRADRDARVRAAGLIVDPPAKLRAMKVAELLKACRGVGDAKLTRLLVRAQVPAGKRVGDLSERQRATLAAGMTE